MIRKFLAAFAVMVLAVVGLTAATTATATGQEVCPDTNFTEAAGGWVKTDGLTSTSWPIPVKPGFTVTDVCYKSSTTVVYPESLASPVESTVLNKPAGETGSSIQNLSHVSVYYTKNLVPQPAVASAAVSVTPATCESGAILVYGAILNAAFSGTADGTVGSPTEYSVTATADSGAEFAGENKTTLVFSGTLAGPNTALCPVVEQFVTVLWQMDTLPDEEDEIGWPQTYRAHEFTDDVDVFDDRLVGKCVGYQVDVYRYTTEADRANVDKLIEGEYLTAPNEPFYEPLEEWKTYVDLDCPVPVPSVTFSHVNDAKCGEASVTVTTANVDESWWYGLHVEVDGVKVGPNVGAAPDLYSSVAVQGPGTSTLPLTFTEDQGGGEVTVKYWVTDATEWDYVPPAMDNSAWWPEAGEETYVEFEVDTDCLSAVPLSATPSVTVTPPTCAAAGSAVGSTSVDYTWAPETRSDGLWLIATQVGNVTLTESEFGPYNGLAKLTGSACLSQTQVVPTAPTVVRTATLAETGFPLLGVLGLAGSFALIGGGLVNARRLLRKSA